MSRRVLAGGCSFHRDAENSASTQMGLGSDAAPAEMTGEREDGVELKRILRS